MDRKILSETKNYVIRAMKKSPDSFHNLDHVDRVRKNALEIITILKLENNVDKILLEAICLLHDLTYSDRKTNIFTWLFEHRLIKKYLQQAFLKINFDEKEKVIIVNAVTKHTLSFPFSKLNKNGDNYTKILQDADTIDFFNNIRQKVAQRFYTVNSFRFVVKPILVHGKKYLSNFLNFPQLSKHLFK